MKTSINDLVVTFATSVVQQNEALRRHDPVVGNKHADRYAFAFRELAALGDAGVNALAVLLDDERIDVRTMAAAFLISHRTQDAIDVLRESAGGKGIVALGATMALRRWEEERKGIDLE